MEKEKVDDLIARMEDKSENEAFRYSDQLAKIGDEYVIKRMIELLYAEDVETKHLAARTLGKIENNQSALAPLFEAIHHPSNKNSNGALVEALSGFDCSNHFVDILKIYLYGNYKASTIAKYMLDYNEFEITPRVIKKAEKHWNHYVHNVKQDESFEARKQEVEEILSDLKALFDESDYETGQ